MKFLVYRDSAGEFRWTLVTKVRVLADSAGAFRSRADCEASIRQVQLSAPSCRIAEGEQAGLLRSTTS